MATIYRRRRLSRKRRPFLPGVGANVTLIASAGSYSLTGNAIAFDSRLNAVAGAYNISGNAVGLNLKMIAAPGAYLLTGNAAAFNSAIRADSGAYAITGSNVGLNTRFVAAGGSYNITGGAISGFVVALLAQPGAYQITGNAVAFPQVFVLEPGAYQITLGEYELRRTGSDYPPDYYGIGHYLEEIEKAKQLDKITRKTPAPIVHETRPRLRPMQQPQQASILAQMPDPQVLITRRLEAEQALQRQAAITKRQRQEAEILFLLAS